MQGTRPGLFFQKVASAHGKRVALGERGQRRRLVLRAFLLLAPHFAPSGTLYDRAAHFESDTGAFQPYRSNVFPALFRESFDHTRGDHLVDLFLFRGEFVGLGIGGEQGVVIGHLLIVHTVAVEFRIGHGDGLISEPRIIPQRGQ